MSSFLVACAWCLFACFFFCKRRNGPAVACLKAVVTLIVIVIIATEVLSRFNAISLVPLVLLWALVNLAGFVLFAWAYACRGGRERVTRKVALIRRTPPLSVRSGVFAAGTVVAVVLACFSAAKQYPYDADSVSYHMSRVATWINQGNVAFATTVNQRQNFYAPGSEYLMLHLQLLAGTDKVSVLPQVAGMLLCLMLVGLLARKLGLGRDEACFAVLAAATIPILIGQSHCNQNELVAGALLLGFTWFLLEFGRSPSWSGAVWCGGAFGMALFTKGTAFIYCAAIGLPLGTWAILRAAARRRAVLRVMLQLALAVAIGLALKGPFVVRCHTQGKTYLDNEFTSELRNTRLGLDILRANAIRNGAVHVGLPDPKWNGAIESWVRETVGEQEANEESSFRTRPFMMHPAISCFYSTNPLHLLLSLLAWLTVPFIARAPRGPTVAYVVASLLSAVLFNLCLKWQYWGIRLQLPWLLLMMPLVGVMIAGPGRASRPRVALQLCVALLLFIGSLPALLFDTDLPLWKTHKPPLVFRDASSIRFNSGTARLGQDHAYFRVAEFLRGFSPAEVGLILPRGNACSDYNWWVVFGNHARPRRPLLRHVGPDAWPPPASPPPEWVISRVRKAEPPVIEGMRYQLAFKSGSCRVYRREQGAATDSTPDH